MAALRKWLRRSAASRDSIQTAFCNKTDALSCEDDAIIGNLGLKNNHGQPVIAEILGKNKINNAQK